jgi:hypothetical protein
MAWMKRRVSLIHVGGTNGTAGTYRQIEIAPAVPEGSVEEDHAAEIAGRLLR